MKLRNIYIAIVSLCLLGAATSCSDFLEEQPKSNIQLPDYFINEYHANAAVNKLYRTGVPEFYDASTYRGAYILFGSFLSGFYDNEYKGQEVIAQYSQDLSISSQNISRDMDDIWDKTYEAIGRANTAIKYIPLIDKLKITESARANTMAAAKFFRALNYFHLVKTYGDVPLILAPYETPKDMYVARTPLADVYKAIETDLLDAIKTFEEQGNNTYFTNNEYRITKGTVQTLLADVYLQMSGYPLLQNNYANAAKYAKLVIADGKHALVTNSDEQINSAYNKLRTTDNLSEYVYSKEYDATISKSEWSRLSVPVLAAGWGIIKYSTTNNACRPLEQLLNVYDPAEDLRIQEKQFFFSKYTYVKDGQTINVTFDHPSPWFYYNEKAMLETGANEKDFPIYRYAEVLLIAAEATAQGGGTIAEAAGYLAQVRARAYTKQTEASIKTSLTALSKDAFTEEVWTERTRELMLEHKIWNDIQRTRKYPTTSSSNKGKVTYVNIIGAKNPWGATFQEKHLLWPISANEMQRNPSLVQNKDY